MGAVAILNRGAHAAPPPSRDAGPQALEVFNSLDRLPHSYFVHLVRDNRNAPLMREGEVVVVDQGGAHQGGWYPVDGDLFVIEYRSELTEFPGQRYPRVSRDVVQTYCDHRGRWNAGAMRHGMVDGMIYCSDGPYTDELQLADRLIGRVVGIYAPQGVRS